METTIPFDAMKQRTTYGNQKGNKKLDTQAIVAIDIYKMKYFKFVCIDVYDIGFVE